MMEGLTKLERAVLEKLLDGDNNVFLEMLREQLPGITVSNRDYTGVGFYTDLVVAPKLVRKVAQPTNMTWGDVEADIEGTQHGAGFLLYVKNGIVSTLEGFTYDEPWPDTVNKFSLAYTNVNRETELSQLQRKGS